jgi:hypothetical protein
MVWSLLLAPTMTRSTLRRSPLGIAALLFVSVEAIALPTLPGCSPTDAARDDALPPPPASCGALPSVGEARARLGTWPSATTLDARVVTSVALASTPFGLAKPGEDRASLFADEASYGANRALSVVEKPFDETKEKLLVVQTWPREASYSYVREGRTVIVRVERVLPCLGAAELEQFRQGYPTFVFVTVPRDVDQVRLEARDATYRLENPVAQSACVRDETAVISGGGAPSAYDEGSAVGLAFGGFSAMTGNVFTSTSTDGIVFSPAGWSQEHLMQFAERGPYAGVYSPFLERVADGYRLTAQVDATERIVDGKIVRRGRAIVETSSKDGVSFGPERVLLDDPTARSPSRVTMTNGESWLYVVGEDGVVRLARETEGR